MNKQKLYNDELHNFYSCGMQEGMKYVYSILVGRPEQQSKALMEA